MRFVGLFLMIISSMPALAIEHADVDVADQIRLGDRQLVLNGVGVRSKFFMKIYVASLYLENRQAHAQAVIDEDRINRISLQFAYSKVEKRKAIDAWNSGFANNLDAVTLERLKDRIASFNAMFSDLYQGDHVMLDYIPGTGTAVVINGKAAGVVPGADFNRALKSIWLGKKPVSDELKEALLGTH